MTWVKRMFYIMKNHNKQEQNQDNIVGRQAYRLIINDVHNISSTGQSSVTLGHIHVFIFSNFREKSIKLLVHVYALNLFIAFYVCTVNMIIIVNFNKINRDCNRNISITLWWSNEFFKEKHTKVFRLSCLHTSSYTDDKLVIDWLLYQLQVRSNANGISNMNQENMNIWKHIVWLHARVKLWKLLYILYLWHFSLCCWYRHYKQTGGAFSSLAHSFASECCYIYSGSSVHVSMINKTDTFVECALKGNYNSTCSIETKIRLAFPHWLKKRRLRRFICINNKIWEEHVPLRHA